MEKNNIFYDKKAFFAADGSPPYLGIDWGTKRIGLAASDDRGMIASPIATVSGLTEIEKAVKDRKIKAFVIGFPLEMSGNIGKKAKEVEEFARQLSTLFPNHPILLEDERLSSYAAERMMIDDFDMNRKKRKKNIDKTAAAFILQGVLDAR